MGNKITAKEKLNTISDTHQEKPGKKIRERFMKSALEEEINWDEKEYNIKGLPVIEVYNPLVFSRLLFYPKNQFAKGLLRFKNHQSFTKAELMLLKRMGFVIKFSALEFDIPDELK